MDRHMSLNEHELALKKKKTMDDYLVQKNYLKGRKDGKL